MGKTNYYKEMNAPLVLVAEDNLVLRAIAKAQLKRYQVEVHLVLNGAEALAAFKTNRYALILMDVNMPEMDGCEATRAIREIERSQGGLSHVPIVAITAGASREDCLQCGMDDHVTKPAEYDRMLQKWLPKFAHSA